MGAEIALLGGSLVLDQMAISNDAKARKQKAKIQSAQIVANREERDRLRRSEQRKRIGQLRARLGAGGTGAGGGSAAAIQSGLIRSDAARAGFEFDAAGRNQQGIQVELAHGRTRDLLKRANSVQSRVIKALPFPS